jgi:hypothetical protein
MEESLDVLRFIAKRYCGHPAVTCIAVCNEPSEAVPARDLCNFFDRAISIIREEGMRPEDVAVSLSIFRTERIHQVWQVWNGEFDGFIKHANVCFDLHIYHCFGPWWAAQSFQGHVHMTKRSRKILRRVPALVGEWSLALPKDLFQNPEAQQLCAGESERLLVIGGADAVLAAWYGASLERGCDVTESVKRQLHESSDNAIVVSNALLGDPAPYCEKRLHVYVKHDKPPRNPAFQQHALKFKENEVLRLPGGVDCIGAAWYACQDGRGVDVSDKLRELLRDSSAGELLASNAHFGDPAPGSEKELRVYVLHETMRQYASAQLEAYSQASHGWFFWNYSDKEAPWDLQRVVAQSWLPQTALAASKRATGTAVLPHRDEAMTLGC